jgi:hypothetical protein
LTFYNIDLMTLLHLKNQYCDVSTLYNIGIVMFWDCDVFPKLGTVTFGMLAFVMLCFVPWT